MIEPKTIRHFEYELSVMLKAAADQDPEGIAQVEAILRNALENGMVEATNEARRRNGWSWAQIGRALGVTSQAAHKRFARKVVAA